MGAVAHDFGDIQDVGERVQQVHPALVSRFYPLSVLKRELLLVL